MPVLMFMPQFHKAVRAGLKRQTIRPSRKRPLKPGDNLSLRAWSGKPYGKGTTHIILREAICKAVRSITIDQAFADDSLARLDGFMDAKEMREWFTNTHGLPFTGDLISW